MFRSEEPELSAISNRDYARPSMLVRKRNQDRKKTTEKFAETLKLVPKMGNQRRRNLSKV